MSKKSSPFFTHKDESEFQAEYLIPKLMECGFAIIQDNHGSTEYGRDLIIAGVDMLGEYRYHGVQTKYETIGLGMKVESIISDAKQAFKMPFTNRTSGEVCHISTFYVMNGGRISPQAQEYFFS